MEELLLLEERGDEETRALPGSVNAIESKPVQNGNGNGVAHKSSHDQSTKDQLLGTNMFLNICVCV